jgi:hypothetical protein
MPCLKSRAVADQLGISYYNLFELIRSKHLVPPEKDSSGDYVWTTVDVERARQAIQARQKRRCGERNSVGSPAVPPEVHDGN